MWCVLADAKVFLLQGEAVADAQDELYRGVLWAYVPTHIIVLCGLCHLLR